MRLENFIAERNVSFCNEVEHGHDLVDSVDFKLVCSKDIGEWFAKATDEELQLAREYYQNFPQVSVDTRKIFRERKKLYNIRDLERIAEELIDNGEFLGETRNPSGEIPMFIGTNGSSGVNDFVEFIKVSPEKVKEILEQPVKPSKGLAGLFD